MNGYHQYLSCIEACVRCATICNHCTISCTLEEDIKMMARCIQLDMECAAICYSSAQLMSLGSERAKEICRLCASCAAMNALNIRRNIVRNVQELVDHVQWNAEEWRHKITPISTQF